MRISIRIYQKQVTSFPPFESYESIFQTQKSVFTFPMKNCPFNFVKTNAKVEF